MESKLVVNLTCRLYFYSDRQYFSARCQELGLTSYGETTDEAVDHFKQMFTRAMQTYREQGKLEAVLERSGIEWWQKDEYPKDRPVYEDIADDLGESVATASSVAGRDADVVHHVDTTQDERPLALLVA